MEKTHKTGPVPKENLIGNKEGEKYREDALKRLPNLKLKEEEKLKQGFKWMNKEKTTILVCPERVKGLLKEGYKIV